MNIKKFIALLVAITVFITYICPAYTQAADYIKERNFWNQRQQVAKKVLENTNRSFSPINKDFSFASPSPLAGEGRGKGSFKVAVTPQSSSEISLPPSFGEIKEVYNSTSSQSPNSQIIVHLQDAHCNYLAQQNIARIIEYLIKNYNLNFVAAEGGMGKLDASFYRSFTNKALVKKTADYFMRKAELTGSEYAVITADQPFLFYGVENNKLYLENLKAYRVALPIEQKWPKVLTGLKNDLAVLKNSLYNEELKEYEAQKNAFNRETEKIHDFVDYLAKVSQVYRLNLAERFPNLDRLINLFNLEGKINFNQVKIERDQFVTELTKEISPEELKSLVEKSEAFRRNQIGAFLYYSYLTELAQKVGGEVFLAAFPNFSAYITYSELAEKLDYNFLFEEMDNLTEELPEKLCANQTQTDLVKFSRNINILEKLAMHQLSKKEWEYYTSHKQNFTRNTFQRFLSRHSLRLSVLGEWDESLAVLESFYRAATKRDAQLAENTLQAMEDVSLSLDGRGKGEGAVRGKVTLAVLIAGGFHTQGITSRLKEKGVSYLVISPQSDSIDNRQLYLSRLRGKHITNKEIIQDFNSALSAPLNLSPLSPNYEPFKKIFITALAASQIFSITELSEPDEDGYRSGVVEYQLGKKRVKAEVIFNLATGEVKIVNVLKKERISKKTSSPSRKKPKKPEISTLISGAISSVASSPSVRRVSANASWLSHGFSELINAVSNWLKVITTSPYFGAALTTIPLLVIASAGSVITAVGLGTIVLSFLPLILWLSYRVYQRYQSSQNFGINFKQLSQIVLISSIIILLLSPASVLSVGLISLPAPLSSILASLKLAIAASPGLQYVFSPILTKTGLLVGAITVGTVLKAGVGLSILNLLGNKQFVKQLESGERVVVQEGILGTKEFVGLEGKTEKRKKVIPWWRGPKDEDEIWEALKEFDGLNQEKIQNQIDKFAALHRGRGGNRNLDKDFLCQIYLRLDEKSANKYKNYNEAIYSEQFKLDYSGERGSYRLWHQITRLVIHLWALFRNLSGLWDTIAYPLAKYLGKTKKNFLTEQEVENAVEEIVTDLLVAKNTTDQENLLNFYSDEQLVDQLSRPALIPLQNAREKAILAAYRPSWQPGNDDAEKIDQGFLRAVGEVFYDQFGKIPGLNKLKFFQRRFANFDQALSEFNEVASQLSKDYPGYSGLILQMTAAIEQAQIEHRSAGERQKTKFNQLSIAGVNVGSFLKTVLAIPLGFANFVRKRSKVAIGGFIVGIGLSLITILFPGSLPILGLGLKGYSPLVVEIFKPYFGHYFSLAAGQLFEAMTVNTLLRSLGLVVFLYAPAEITRQKNRLMDTDKTLNKFSTPDWVSPGTNIPKEKVPLLRNLEVKSVVEFINQIKENKVLTNQDKTKVLDEMQEKLSLGVIRYQGTEYLLIVNRLTGLRNEVYRQIQANQLGLEPDLAQAKENLDRMMVSLYYQASKDTLRSWKFWKKVIKDTPGMAAVTAEITGVLGVGDTLERATGLPAHQIASLFEEGVFPFANRALTAVNASLGIEPGVTPIPQSSPLDKETAANLDKAAFAQLDKLKLEEKQLALKANNLIPTFRDGEIAKYFKDGRYSSERLMNLFFGQQWALSKEIPLPYSLETLDNGQQAYKFTSLPGPFGPQQISVWHNGDISTSFIYNGGGVTDVSKSKSWSPPTVAYVPLNYDTYLSGKQAGDKLIGGEWQRGSISENFLGLEGQGKFQPLVTTWNNQTIYDGRSWPGAELGIKTLNLNSSILPDDLQKVVAGRLRTLGPEILVEDGKDRNGGSWQTFKDFSVNYREGLADPLSFFGYFLDAQGNHIAEDVWSAPYSDSRILHQTVFKDGKYVKEYYTKYQAPSTQNDKSVEKIRFLGRAEYNGYPASPDKLISSTDVIYLKQITLPNNQVGLVPIDKTIESFYDYTLEKTTLVNGPTVNILKDKNGPIISSWNEIDGKPNEVANYGYPTEKGIPEQIQRADGVNITRTLDNTAFYNLLREEAWKNGINLYNLTEKVNPDTKQVEIHTTIPSYGKNTTIETILANAQTRQLVDSKEKVNDQTKTWKAGYSVTIDGKNYNIEASHSNVDDTYTYIRIDPNTGDKIDGVIKLGSFNGKVIKELKYTQLPNGGEKEEIYSQTDFTTTSTYSDVNGHKFYRNVSLDGKDTMRTTWIDTPEGKVEYSLSLEDGKITVTQLDVQDKPKWRVEKIGDQITSYTEIQPQADGTTVEITKLYAEDKVQTVLKDVFDRPIERIVRAINPKTQERIEVERAVRIYKADGTSTEYVSQGFGEKQVNQWVGDTMLSSSSGASDGTIIWFKTAFDKEGKPLMENGKYIQKTTFYDNSTQIDYLNRAGGTIESSKSTDDQGKEIWIETSVKADWLPKSGHWLWYKISIDKNGRLIDQETESPVKVKRFHNGDIAIDLLKVGGPVVSSALKTSDGKPKWDKTSVDENGNWLFEVDEKGISKPITRTFFYDIEGNKSEKQVDTLRWTLGPVEFTQIFASELDENGNWLVDKETLVFDQKNYLRDGKFHQELNNYAYNRDEGKNEKTKTRDYSLRWANGPFDSATLIRYFDDGPKYYTVDYKYDDKFNQMTEVISANDGSEREENQFQRYFGIYELTNNTKSDGTYVNIIRDENGKIVQRYIDFIEKGVHKKAVDEYSYRDGRAFAERFELIDGKKGEQIGESIYDDSVQKGKPLAGWNRGDGDRYLYIIIDQSDGNRVQLNSLITKPTIPKQLPSSINIPVTNTTLSVPGSDFVLPSSVPIPSVNRSIPLPFGWTLNGLVSVDILPHDTSFIIDRIDTRFKEVIKYKNLKDNTVEGHIFELRDYQVDEKTGKIIVNKTIRNWLGISNKLDQLMGLVPEEVRKYNKYFEQVEYFQWHGIYFLWVVPLVGYWIKDISNSIWRWLKKKRTKPTTAPSNREIIIQRMADFNAAVANLMAIEGLENYKKLRGEKEQLKIENLKENNELNYNLQNQFHKFPKTIKEKMETITGRDYEKYKTTPHDEQFQGLPAEIKSLLKTTRTYQEYQDKIIDVLMDSLWQEISRKFEIDIEMSREEIKDTLNKLEANLFKELVGDENYNEYQKKLAKFVQKEIIANFERAPFGDIATFGEHIKSIVENTRKNLILPFSMEITEAMGLPAMEKELAKLKQDLKEKREKYYEQQEIFNDAELVRQIEELDKKIHRTKHIIQFQLGKIAEELTRDAVKKYAGKRPKYATVEEIKKLNAWQDWLTAEFDKELIGEAIAILEKQKKEGDLDWIRSQEKLISDLARRDTEGSEIQPVLYEKLALITKVKGVVEKEVENTKDKKEERRLKKQLQKLELLRNRTISVKREQQKLVYLNQWHEAKGREAIINIFSQGLLNTFRDGSVIPEWYQDTVGAQRYRGWTIATQIAGILAFIGFTQMNPWLGLFVAPSMYYSAWVVSHKYSYRLVYNYPRLIFLNIGIIVGALAFSWVGIAGAALIVLAFHYGLSPLIRSKFKWGTEPTIMGHRRNNYSQIKQSFQSDHRRTGKKVRIKYEVPILSDMPDSETIAAYIEKVRTEKGYVKDTRIRPILNDLFNDILGDKIGKEEREKEIEKRLNDLNVGINEKDNKLLKDTLIWMFETELETNKRIMAEILIAQGIKPKLIELLIKNGLKREQADKIADDRFVEYIVGDDRASIASALTMAKVGLVDQIINLEEAKIVRDIISKEYETVEKLKLDMTPDKHGKYKQDPLTVFLTYLLQTQAINGPLNYTRKNIENFSESFLDYYGEDVMMVYDLPFATKVPEMFWREMAEFKKLEKRMNDKFNVDSNGIRLAGEKKRVAMVYLHINQGKVGKKVGDQVDVDQFFQHGYTQRDATHIYRDKMKFQEVREGVPMFDLVMGDVKTALGIEETQEGEVLATNEEVIKAILKGDSLRVRRILSNVVLDNKNEVYPYEMEPAYGIAKHWANSHLRKLTPFIFVENPEIGTPGKGGRKAASQLFVNLQGARIINLLDEVMKTTVLQAGQRNYQGVAYGKWFENTEYVAQEYESEVLNFLYLLSHDFQQGVFGGPTEIAIGASNLQILPKKIGDKEYLLKFIMGDEVEIFKMTVTKDEEDAFEFNLLRYTQSDFGESRDFKLKIYKPQAEPQFGKVNEVKYLDEYSRIVERRKYKEPVTVDEGKVDESEEESKLASIEVYTYTRDGFSLKQEFEGKNLARYKGYKQEQREDFWKSKLLTVLGNRFSVGERDFLAFIDILLRDIRWDLGDMMMIFTWSADIVLKFVRWLRNELPIIYFNNFNRKSFFTPDQFFVLVLGISTIASGAVAVVFGNYLAALFPTFWLGLGLSKVSPRLAESGTFFGLVVLTSLSLLLVGSPLFLCSAAFGFGLFLNRQKETLQTWLITLPLPILGFMAALSPKGFLIGSGIVSGTATVLVIFLGNYWLFLVPVFNLAFYLVWRSARTYSYSKMYPPYFSHHLRGLFRRFLNDYVFRAFLFFTSIPALVFGLAANLIYTPEHSIVPYLMGGVLVWMMYGIIGVEKFDATLEYKKQQLRELGKEVPFRKNPLRYIAMWLDIIFYLHRTTTANTMVFLGKVDIGSRKPMEVVISYLNNIDFRWGRALNDTLANIERLLVRTWAKTVEFFKDPLVLGGFVYSAIGILWWLGITYPPFFWLFLIVITAFTLGSFYFNWWTAEDLLLNDEWRFFKPLWAVTTVFLWTTAAIAWSGVTVPYLPNYWRYFAWLILVVGLALEYPYNWLFNKTDGISNWEKLKGPGGINSFWQGIKANLKQVPLVKGFFTVELIAVLSLSAYFINPLLAFGLAMIHFRAGKEGWLNQIPLIGRFIGQGTLQTIGFIGAMFLVLSLLRETPLIVLGAILMFVGSLSVYSFAQSDVPSPQPSDKFEKIIKNKWKVLQQVGKSL